MSITKHCYIQAFLGAVACVPGSTLAQATANQPDLCAPAHVGSAVGAAACFAVRLGAAEAALDQLETKYGSEVVAASSDPSNARRVVDAEAASWRAYRGAKCELYGETEGGSDRWKVAMAASCEVDEANARIAMLRKRVAKE